MLENLRVDSVTVEYEKRILEKVSYTFFSGKFYLIKGASGIGKSSLLNVLGLLRRPKSGRVLADGLDLWQLSDAERANYRLANFGFIFQNHNLIDGLTLSQNLQIPLQKAETTAMVRKQRVQATLAALELTERGNAPISNLSGGEDQRGAIGRALVTDAQVIFADEPTNSLDQEKAVRFYEQLRDLAHRLHKIVIVVTHEELPEKFADVVLTIQDRQLVAQTDAAPQTTHTVVGKQERDVPATSLTVANARAYNHMNLRAKRQVPWPILVVVTVLLALAGIMLTVPQVLANEQLHSLSKATDNSIFVTNDTLHSHSSQDLDSFWNLSAKEKRIIHKLPGVRHVYNYFTFVSNGLTKNNARASQPNSTILQIGTHKYAITNTYNIEPLYPEEARKSYLYAQGKPTKKQDGIYLAQTFLTANHIQKKAIVGQTIKLTAYVPYWQFISTSELPDDNHKTVRTDGNIYATVPIKAKVRGVLAANYPHARSEFGNALFMKYSTMQSILRRTIAANPVSKRIFPNFKQQPFGYSALVVEARTFNDTAELSSDIAGIAPALHVTSVAQDTTALNRSIQSAQTTATNLAVLIILGAVVALTITFFLTAKGRMREIGILKAIGYTTADVRQILLANGLRYGTLIFGGAEVIDIAALLLLMRVSLVFPAQYLLATTIANLVLAFGAVVSASLWPMRKLSSLDPVTVIAQN